MKNLIGSILLAFIFLQCTAKQKVITKDSISQKNVINSSFTKRPKLVIGLIVDQMRYDYLVKFYNKFGENGFKKLIKQGYNLKNAHFNYIPTYTAVGHSSIYTGTTPSHHGIISNTWYDKFLKKEVYCVDDTNYQTVGAKSGGSTSPNRLVTTTITDQLKLAQNTNGKTIGIAIKDRSAVLPAGHAATAAYWFKGGNDGKFITSTYYMNKLPKWVILFNKSGKANDYLNKTWDTYYNIETYTESIEDNNPYEGSFKGKKTPTFPYILKKLRAKNKNYSLLKKVPAGNSITTDFAIAAIEGENLGKSNYTDFLAISYSSTDYIGHQFGVNSKEIEDTYIRFDKEIERLLNYLNTHIGKENYTLFLTADHAAVSVPAYLNKLKIPAGYFDYKDFKKYVNNITKTYFGTNNIIENVSNFQLFLNKEKIQRLNLDINNVVEVLVNEIINYKKIYKVVSARTLQKTEFNSGILQELQKGYNQKYSGDILLVPFPATISYPKTGSTHGSGYSYDTHVPLIFYGYGIKQGESNKYYPITNISPTIASLLNILHPSGCTGKTIEEVLK